MSHPVAPEQIAIPVNDGPAVLDRAGLVDKVVEFEYDEQGPRAFRVVKIARNYGITQLLLENSREERTWFNLSIMKNICIL